MTIGKKQIQGTLYDYYAGEILPDGYIEIADIKECIYGARDCQKDYKWIRKYLQGKNWDSLSDSDKFIIAQYKASSENNCKQILGEAYNFWMTDFDIKSIDCRINRFSLAKTILIKNVSLSNRYEI